jgi:hypothetical protein
VTCITLVCSLLPLGYSSTVQPIFLAWHLPRRERNAAGQSTAGARSAERAAIASVIRETFVLQL